MMFKEDKLITCTLFEQLSSRVGDWLQGSLHNILQRIFEWKTMTSNKHHGDLAAVQPQPQTLNNIYCEMKSAAGCGLFTSVR